jgi:hypothetical protein
MAAATQAAAEGVESYAEQIASQQAKVRFGAAVQGSQLRCFWMATLARMGNLEGDVPGCIARGKNYSGLKAVTSPGFEQSGICWKMEV